MKEMIRQILASAPDSLTGRSLVREYCQARILQFLQEKGAFRSWIFHGGTALRFLYGLPRYSEDLDFALERSGPVRAFADLIASVCGSFEHETYAVETKITEKRTVWSAFIRFPGLFHEFGLSPRRTEVFSVKIEVDSHPPSGGMTETTVVRRYVMLHLLHYNKSSLLSGKLHAILARSYVKGRDLYDLFWYLSDPSWPDPNIQFLQEALHQTGWKGPRITPANWARITAKRLQKVKWAQAVEDTRPFIERSSDLDLLTKENVLKLLQSGTR
jgi:predicted nucleotidyltransferase component of viral defense system